MLWRACRGNVFLRQAEIEDALEDPASPSGEVLKSVFVIFFQGEQLKSRVKKICEGFRATLYPCPDQVRKSVIQGRRVTLYLSLLNRPPIAERWPSA